MRIKCLPLHHWMTSSLKREDTLKYYKACTPVLSRPGIYMIGLRAFFELEDGRAFVFDQKQFKYDLAVLHAAELDHRKVAALAAVVSQRLATKKQQELLWKCRDAAGLRAAERNSRKHVMLYMKEYL